ncbi:MAG: hypothetical protein WCO78_03835 [Candidatus Roizmanbacteria bacterium]
MIKHILFILVLTGIVGFLCYFNYSDIAKRQVKPDDLLLNSRSPIVPTQQAQNIQGIATKEPSVTVTQPPLNMDDNSKRQTDVTRIAILLSARLYEDKGAFPYLAQPPITLSPFKSGALWGGGGSAQKLCEYITGTKKSAIIPESMTMSVLPTDPGGTSKKFISCSNFDTGYEIMFDVNSKKVTVSAPSTEGGEKIISATL